MSKKLSPYGRKEWHRKHSTSKEMRWLNKGIDAAFKEAGSIGKSAPKTMQNAQETQQQLPTEVEGASALIGFLAFLVLYSKMGTILAVLFGIVAAIVSLFVLSVVYGGMTGKKERKLKEETAKKEYNQWVADPHYEPNPEWMGDMDLVDSRANARILAPQFLKQAQESAKILQTTTEPATFFTRYDFCVGRLMELEKCKKYCAPVSATADLKKYRSLSFRDDAVKEIIHRTEEKYRAKIEGLKTAKAKQNWAEKYHQAFEPYLPYMTDGQKSELGEASAYLFDLAQK